MLRPGTSATKQVRGTSMTKMQILYGQNQKGVSKQQAPEELPKFESFVEKSDWTGAIALLELEKFAQRPESLLWLGYCFFHNGDYKKALGAYTEVSKRDSAKKLILERALCLFGLFRFAEARELAEKAADCSLKYRIMYQCSQKLNNDSALMAAHRRLSDSVEDQLSVAAIHLLRSHLDDSVDIYKKLLLEGPNLKALNYYLALCYYKQELYELAEEVLKEYLNAHPDSILANNLAAALQFQLKGDFEANESLKKLEKKYEGADLYSQSDCLTHNKCVFSSGENALKVFPPLIDVFPEARLNLVIYHMKKGNWEDAFKIVQDIEPSNPKEYCLKGVVCAVYGQKKNNKEILIQAQHDFQTVGKIFFISLKKNKESELFE